MSTRQLPRAADPQTPGTTRISDVNGQDRVRVTGTIIATEVISVGSSFAYRCVLADGTGELDLLFLGRAAIAGLAVGTRCSIQGVVTTHGGRLAVWNPRYQVHPAREIPDRGEPSAEGAPGAAAGTGGAEGAGHFRVYLAAAPGAGKTVAMLDEGRRLRAQGADVVIAVIEDHDRPVTQAHAAGLEIVPRRTWEYRGARFEEMDLDGVLRRSPGVALADELAHTNVPGAGRNTKRWQDVLDLLDADIDVIATVNIQHLASVADTVEQIAQVRVRERVPDWVVRRADRIEFVDSSPGQLRHRLRHGEIYPAGQVSQALTHFFRTDTLTVLRELALRFLADEPEEEFVRYLARLRARARPEGAERMLVGVTAAPGAEAIVRRAARIAAGIQADLDVVHVASQTVVRPGPDDDLARLRHVVADVGATWHDLDADDLVRALVEYAKSERATQIVVGSSRRSRWQELIGGGSIVGRVSRRAAHAGIDVHIVALREVGVGLG